MDLVCCAGTQGGKTFFQAPYLLRLIQRAAPLIKKLGRGNFIYAGPTMTLMEAQAIPSFEALFVDFWGLGKLVLGTKPKFFLSAEGAKKLFGKWIGKVTVHFAYASSSSNLESLTAIGAVWDECGQPENKLSAFRAMNRRLLAARSTSFKDVLQVAIDAGLTWWIEWFYDNEGPDATFGQRCFGTTPYEWGWFKTNVYDPAKARVKGFALIRFASWMNPFVSKAQCRELLERGMPLWEWLMMHLGVFTKPAGSIYGHAFDKKRNVIPRFAIPNAWPRYVGVDFGPINMAAIFAAYDPENHRYIVYRTYHRGVAGIPTRRDKGNPSGESGHIDNWLLDEPVDIHGNPRIPSAFGGAYSEDDWREDFAEEGFPILRPDVKDVEVGISIVRAMLISGQLVFFEDQTKVIGEIESYSRVLDDQGNPTKEIKDKAKYHRGDGVRYLCVGVSSGIADAPIVVNRNGETQVQEKQNETRYRGREEGRESGIVVIDRDEQPTDSHHRRGTGRSGRAWRNR